MTYIVDANQSTLTWEGVGVGKKHNGTVAIASGEVDIEDGTVTGGTITIDMTSITNVDLPEEAQSKLVGHLKSDDFFSVGQHPTAMFAITSVGPLDADDEDDATHTVHGTLTIKSIAKAVEFPASIAIGEDAATVEASFLIDRTEWNVKFGSGKFFKGLGDKLIKDEIGFTVKLVAKKSE